MLPFAARVVDAAPTPKAEVKAAAKPAENCGFPDRFCVRRAFLSGEERSEEMRRQRCSTEPTVAPRKRRQASPTRPLLNFCR